MIEHRVNLPTIGLIAGTRVALGVGLGLLVADRLTPERREACGWTLLTVGALTTIPLVWEVFGSDGDNDRRRVASAKRSHGRGRNRVAEHN
jgi:hypothetical protein